MKYVVTINDKNYEVLVEKSEATLLNVTDAAPIAAPAAVPAPAAETVPAVATTPAPAAPAAAAAPAAGSVASPMPGTILEIKKTPGSPVKKGEVVLILEAMKMENEIPAPSDGVIGQIFVSKNASVSTGDPLFSVN